ncbi:MAG: pentapeptide repeat-containing protein [Bacteroidota bacterium]
MMNKLLTKITDSEVGLALFAFILTLISLFVITVLYDPRVSLVGEERLGLYNKPDFWENVLVESHGMLLDLLIIGVFLFWLQKRTAARRDKKRDVQRYQEELNDYRGWADNEASFRVAGLIRRLGEESIDFHQLHLGRCSREIIRRAIDQGTRIFSLEGADLKTFDFSGVNCWNVNMSQTDLAKANLSKANFSMADFSESRLKNTNLSESELRGAKFDGAFLSSTILTKASAEGTSFSKSVLFGSMFNHATLTYTRFEEAEFLQSVFENATLFAASLKNCKVNMVSFENAKLEESRWEGSTLSQVNFQHANLSRADFRFGLELNKVDFRGTDLVGVKVEDPDWLTKLDEWEVVGAEKIQAKYTLVFVPQKDEFSRDHFILVNKEALENHDQKESNPLHSDNPSYSLNALKSKKYE